MISSSQILAPSNAEALPLNVAFVVREGRDVTLISWGAMVKDTLDAADELTAEDTDAEVIDLATLNPMTSKQFWIQ